MRKVELNMKELEKYELIKKLVETNGNKLRAAIKIGCSRRTVNRLIKKYKSEGKEAFSHKNKGRSPINKIDDHLKDKIIGLYKKEYEDANIRHFSEIIEEDLDIKISSETIRLWLLEEKILSPKAHRKTKKRLKRILKEELQSSKSCKEANLIKTKIEEIQEDKAHPRRPRKKYLGEMIQMDASSKYWINEEKWHLHLAIDDASGKVLGAYFDYQETLKAYYNVFYQILTNYGIPAMFYTDKWTVFEYKRKKRLFDDEDYFTQFSYACHKLGVHIETSSIPEAKGRVERLNQTFKSRLPIELRRAKIKKIEEANAFLKSYLTKYNNSFALQEHNIKSVFDPQPSLKDINQSLAILSVRTIDGGNSIKYNNKFYRPISQYGNYLNIYQGIKVIMIETFDGQLLVNILDNIYRLKEVILHEKYSAEFDADYIPDIKTSWTPPKNHPWRSDDFLGFIAKQKHRQDIRT